jgi:acyl-CoA synthetase (AMP-forming)/AMP-acid ligase II
MNHRWLPTEIAAVLADCTAQALVVQADHLAPDGLAVLAALPRLQLLLGFGKSDPRLQDYEAALASAGPPPPRERSLINVIGYTSGTTGKPKGAALTPDAAIVSAFWFAALFGLQPHDHFLACMPIYVYRGGAGGLAPFVAGARSVLTDFDAAAVLDKIERERITHAIFAPVMVDRLLQQPDVAERDLTSLKSVWLGGAPSSPSVITALQALVGDIVGSTYGGTEATGIAQMRWPADAAQSHLLRSAGRPSPLMDVRLVTADGSEAGLDEPGEVVVRGEAVMSGYWPEVDGGGLDDGWYRTGDIATRDECGYLYLVDRSVDIVNSGGLNVYSTEVEHVLLEHPAVVECAVVGAPDAGLGEMVTAYIVATTPVSEADIDAHCRSRLAGYKRPRAIALVAELPRNAMGKVDKRALRDRLWAGRDGQVGAAEASVTEVRPTT